LKKARRKLTGDRGTYGPFDFGTHSAFSHEPTIYYFAYGSNLDTQQMRRRCPDAVRVDKLALKGYALVFRGPADIIRKPGSVVHGAVYLISESDQFTLDIYEGYRKGAPGEGLYRKEYFGAKHDGRQIEVMFYVMNRKGFRVPAPAYLATIEQGYKDWGLPLDALLRAEIKAYERRERAFRKSEQPRLPVFDSDAEWLASRTEEELSWLLR